MKVDAELIELVKWAVKFLGEAFIIGKIVEGIFRD